MTDYVTLEDLLGADLTKVIDERIGDRSLHIDASGEVRLGDDPIAPCLLYSMTNMSCGRSKKLDEALAAARSAALEAVRPIRESLPNGTTVSAYRWHITKEGERAFWIVEDTFDD